MHFYTSYDLCGVCMRESEYQGQLRRKLKNMFPGCEVFKQDARQGLPDLLILYGSRWAMLEVKISHDAPTRPNQPYYVELYNAMSFARFIYPENEEEVLLDLQRSFRTGR